MKIKILQYKLFDVKIKDTELLAFMSANFKMIESNTSFFKDIKSPLLLFHNNKDKYSSIQFAVENNYLVMTAYGAKEIKALKIWLRLFKKTHKLKLKNTQTILETYQLEIANTMQTYNLSNFLISRDKNKQLQKLKNKKDFNRAMANYIMANFLPFFNHIGYMHDRNKNEINVALIYCKKRANKNKPFKNASNLISYDIRFKTNLIIPHIIHIGQSTSKGFGKISWQE